MAHVQRTWGGAYVPKIGVRFVRDTQRSPVFLALIDSGAEITLANKTIATEGLGLVDDDFEAAERIEMIGAGGARIWARRFELEIEVGAKVGGTAGQPLILPRSTVCFTESKLPYPVLLGQHDFFAQLVYVQRTQYPNPEFVLDRPRTTSRAIQARLQQ